MPTITVTLDTPLADRYAAAVGEIHDYKEANGVTPRPATLAESRQHLLEQMRNDVLASEARRRERAAPSAPFNPQ